MVIIDREGQKNNEIDNYIFCFSYFSIKEKNNILHWKLYFNLNMTWWWDFNLFVQVSDEILWV